MQISCPQKRERKSWKNSRLTVLWNKWKSLNLHSHIVKKEDHYVYIYIFTLYPQGFWCIFNTCRNILKLLKSLFSSAIETFFCLCFFYFGIHLWVVICQIFFNTFLSFVPHLPSPLCLADHAQPHAWVSECTLHLWVSIQASLSLHALGTLHPCLLSSWVRIHLT